MADAVTLIVLVAAGQGSSTATRALTRATREALGTAAHVTAIEAPGEPNDGEARRVESSETADAVVEVAWIDGRHHRAHLRLHVAHDDRWIDRSFGFSPTDAEFERGRALGFAIASLLPDAAKPAHSTAQTGSTPDAGAPGGNMATSATTDRAAPAPAPSTPARTSDRAPAPSPAPTSTASTAAGPPPPQAPAGPSAPPSGPSAPAASPAPVPTSRANSPDTSGAGPSKATPATTAEKADALALDLYAMAAPPVGETGDATWGPTWGGAVAARWTPSSTLPFLALEATIGAAYEHLRIAARAADVTSAFGSAGVVWQPLRPSSRSRWGASLRADAALVYTSVAHASLTRGVPVGSRLNVVVDVSFRVARHFDVVAGAGAERAIAAGHVGLPGVSSGPAPFPTWFGLFEAGFRVAF